MGHKHRKGMSFFSPVFARREPPKPYSEWSEKELLDKIHEIEYRRIILQKQKIPNVRKTELEIVLTGEINVLYKELEKKQNERKGKENIR